MELNWDAFLNNESLDIPNDQWSDLTTLPTDTPTSEMPKSITTNTSGSTPEKVNNFDSILNGTSIDPYFDNSVFISNEYFLSDLEVLQPFGNTAGGGASTSESSPEPASAVSQSPQNPAALLAEINLLPQMTTAQRQAVQRANTQPNPAYESMFPNNLETGFVEDLTFPDGPKGISTTSTKPAPNKSQTTTKTQSKRNKNSPDILSACWTSPLCPNHDQDGPPPNPSTCGGGCAPFLFADDDALPIISDLLAEPQEVTAADGIVEIQPRPNKKRSESATSMNEPSGRQSRSNNTTASPTESRQRVKSEMSEDSPPKESPKNIEEQKSKSRRRLPHNQVERKYRESLNTQLESLKRVVPSLQQNAANCDGADIEDLPTPSKPSKAVILASATAYIKQQEKDKKQLADENQLLRARIKALQALVKCDDCSLMQYVMDLKINQAKQ
ncbi:hypothetical protein EK21DRAFT_109197 [Setomelanomma holmii]|uniref:BHLH domain-containing protein n=1 Tax=Setomelanomma holmii TaxID=210430 RepID=A0A9P4LPD8_9PLEO|nr:hypothetical protein EK21DRAFT_109197 [Setomelanomma holmii]